MAKIIFYSAQGDKNKMHYAKGVMNVSTVNLNAYDPNQPRDPKGSSTGGQWTSERITIPVSKVAPKGRSLLFSFKKGVKAKSEEVGKTGHGFRYMSDKEFEKFAAGEIRYGGISEEYKKGGWWANAPGDFLSTYVKEWNQKPIYLVEVNVQGEFQGLAHPNVGLENVVGAWFYNPTTGTFENVIK